MKNAELQVLSVNPTADTNKIMLFANTGGYVLKKNNAGVEIIVSSEFSGSLANPSVKTGTNGYYLLTGSYFGEYQAAFATGMGTPKFWLPCRVNGVNAAIPAYALA